MKITAAQAAAILGFLGHASASSFETRIVADTPTKSASGLQQSAETDATLNARQGFPLPSSRHSADEKNPPMPQYVDIKLGNTARSIPASAPGRNKLDLNNLHKPATANDSPNMEKRGGGFDGVRDKEIYDQIYRMEHEMSHMKDHAKAEKKLAKAQEKYREKQEKYADSGDDEMLETGDVSLDSGKIEKRGGGFDGVMDQDLYNKIYRMEHEMTLMKDHAKAKKKLAKAQEKYAEKQEKYAGDSGDDEMLEAGDVSLDSDNEAEDETTMILARSASSSRLEKQHKKALKEFAKMEKKYKKALDKYGLTDEAGLLTGDIVDDYRDESDAAELVARDVSLDNDHESEDEITVIFARTEASADNKPPKGGKKKHHGDSDSDSDSDDDKLVSRQVTMVGPLKTALKGFKNEDEGGKKLAARDADTSDDEAFVASADNKSPKGHKKKKKHHHHHHNDDDDDDDEKAVVEKRDSACITCLPALFKSIFSDGDSKMATRDVDSSDDEASKKPKPKKGKGKNKGGKKQHPSRNDSDTEGEVDTPELAAY